MELQLLVEGGNAKPGPALSQQLGPLGINLGKLIAEVNKVSEKYKGMRVPVIVDINPETKSFEISLRRPPASELVKKELGLDKGAADSKIKIANLAVEQAIKIAKDKQEDMLTSSFKNAVKNVIATCTSFGVIVEGKEPRDTIKDIDEGKFDDIINQQKTEISPEKQKTLDEQFERVKAVIEKRLKAEEAEKAAEEAKQKKAEEEKPEGEGEGKEGVAKEGEGKPGEAKKEAGKDAGKDAKAPGKDSKGKK